MRKYNNILYIIPTFYLYYTIIAFFGVLSDKYEIFPVFNWSLFTYVTDVRNFCEIEVISIGDELLDAPTPYYSLPSKFAGARNRSPTVFKLLQKVCRAKRQGQAEKFAKLRAVLESNFLADQRDVHYRLVVNTYNPIDRWRDGTVISSEVLGNYNSNERRE